jgi:hypothetical protein
LEFSEPVEMASSTRDSEPSVRYFFKEPKERVDFTEYRNIGRTEFDFVQAKCYTRYWDRVMNLYLHDNLNNEYSDKSWAVLQQFDYDDSDYRMNNCRLFTRDGLMNDRKIASKEAIEKINLYDDIMLTKGRISNDVGAIFSNIYYKYVYKATRHRYNYVSGDTQTNVFNMPRYLSATVNLETALEYLFVETKDQSDELPYIIYEFEVQPGIPNISYDKKPIIPYIPYIPNYQSHFGSNYSYESEVLFMRSCIICETGEKKLYYSDKHKKEYLFITAKISWPDFEFLKKCHQKIVRSVLFDAKPIGKTIEELNRWIYENKNGGIFVGGKKNKMLQYNINMFGGGNNKLNGGRGKRTLKKCSRKVKKYAKKIRSLSKKLKRMSRKSRKMRGG